MPNPYRSKPEKKPNQTNKHKSRKKIQYTEKTSENSEGRGKNKNKTKGKRKK